MIFILSIFIIVATVPTGLQFCAKLLQMHISGNGWAPWLQPKSKVTFKFPSEQSLKLFAADFGFKYFHYSGHCAHKVANLCKSAAMHLSEGGGSSWLKPKSYVTFELAST